MKDQVSVTRGREAVIAGLKDEIARAEYPRFPIQWLDCVEVALLRDALKLLEMDERMEDDLK